MPYRESGDVKSEDDLPTLYVVPNQRVTKKRVKTNMVAGPAAIEAIVFESAPVGIIVWGRDGRVHDWNPEAERIFGWKKEEAIAQESMRFLVPAEVVPHVETIFDTLLNLKRPEDLTNENLTKEGATIWCEWRNIPIFGTENSSSGFVSVVQDITDRVRSEQTLRESEQRFRKAFLYSGQAAALLDCDGRFLDCNPALAEMLGYSKSELSSMSLEEVSHGDDLRNDLGKWSSVLTADVDHSSIEKRFVHRDGHIVETNAILSLIREVDGSPLQFVAQIQDVTQENLAARERTAARERAEAMNKELHTAMVYAEKMAIEAERLAQAKNVLFQAIPVILIGLTPEGIVHEWNHAATRSFGIDARDAIGKDISELPMEWPWQLIELALVKCEIQHMRVTLEDLSFRKLDGVPGFLQVAVTPVMDADGSKGALIMAEDVTERKNLEGHLAQAQKLEAIGQLAAGVAHEINTPTQYVGDNVRFLKRAFEAIFPVLTDLNALMKEDVCPELQQILAHAKKARLEYILGEIPSAFDEAIDGVDRVKTIVQAMKEFSHPGSEDMVSLDLNKALMSTLTVARNEFKYVAEAVTDFDQEVGQILCYAGELNQVFLNVVVNAAHAIADAVRGTTKRGIIRVYTKRLDNWIEIRISDTGTGIPELVRSRVFDPFFTTKEVGKGTGQGLAIAHRVVTKRHLGTIGFETQEGLGTTFIIRLPADADMNELQVA